MARAKLKPRKQANKQALTLRSTFPTALIKCPCKIRFNVSNEKVENVVKPPNTPTNTANRTSSETLIRSISVYERNPISSEPTTLINSVP